MNVAIHNGLHERSRTFLIYDCAMGDQKRYERKEMRAALQIRRERRTSALYID